MIPAHDKSELSRRTLMGTLAAGVLIPLAAGCGGNDGNDDGGENVGFPSRRQLAGRYTGTWSLPSVNGRPADGGAVDIIVSGNGAVTGSFTSAVYGPSVAVGGTLRPGARLDIGVEFPSADTFQDVIVIVGRMYAAVQNEQVTSLEATINVSLFDPPRLLRLELQRAATA